MNDLEESFRRRYGMPPPDAYHRPCVRSGKKKRSLPSSAALRWTRSDLEGLPQPHAIGQQGNEPQGDGLWRLCIRAA